MGNLQDITKGQQCIRKYFYKSKDLFKFGKTKIPIGTKIISFSYYPINGIGNVYFFNPMGAKLLSFEDVSIDLLFCLEKKLLDKSRLKMITENDWNEYYSPL